MPFSADEPVPSRDNMGLIGLISPPFGGTSPTSRPNGARCFDMSSGLNAVTECLFWVKPENQNKDRINVSLLQGGDPKIKL